MAEPIQPTKCDDEQGPGSGPSSKRIKPCQNPLTPDEVKQQVFSNELIIGQILQHLPFESVLNFRLLSKVWCNEAIKTMKAHRRMLRFDLTPVHVVGEDHSRYLQVIRKENAEEFIEFALRSSPKIFTRFSFFGNQLNSAPIAGFLETYGPVIIEAEIEWKSGVDVGLLSVFREVLLFALPNLRILHLKNVPASWHPATTKVSNIFPPYLTTQMKLNPLILQRLVEVNLDLANYALATNLEVSYIGIDVSYQVLKNILEIAPNIEKIPCLQLVVLHQCNFTSLTNLRAEIFKINQKKDQNILKGVKLLNCSGLSFLRHNMLLKEGIFLPNITISVSYSRTSGTFPMNFITIFEKMLDNQKSSLKSLHLQLKCLTSSGEPASLVTEGKFIKLPVLEKLQELKIVLFTPYHVIPSTDSLGDNLPNLHIVSLCGGSTGFRLNAKEIHALRGQGGINETVKVLKLEGTVHTPSFLEWAVGLFPNVKHLSVNELSQDVYPTLWRSWPEIQSFYIDNTTNLTDVDSVFTGMTAKTCQEFLNELNRSVAEDVPEKETKLLMWYSDLVGCSSNTAPAITKWKNLRKLYINYTNKEFGPENENSSNYISDATGCTAFSKMKNLQELVVGYCKISTYCTNILESQMNYVKISDVVLT